MFFLIKYRRMFRKQTLKPKLGRMGCSAMDTQITPVMMNDVPSNSYSKTWRMDAYGGMDFDMNLGFHSHGGTPVMVGL
jgi:hypothetical protein